MGKPWDKPTLNPPQNMAHNLGRNPEQRFRQIWGQARDNSGGTTRHKACINVIRSNCDVRYANRTIGNLLKPALMDWARPKPSRRGWGGDSPASCRTLKRLSAVTRFSPAVNTRRLCLSRSSFFHMTVFSPMSRTTHVMRASSPSYTWTGCGKLSLMLGVPAATQRQSG